MRLRVGVPIVAVVARNCCDARLLIIAQMIRDALSRRSTGSPRSSTCGWYVDRLPPRLRKISSMTEPAAQVVHES